MRNCAWKLFSKISGANPAIVVMEVSTIGRNLLSAVGVVCTHKNEGVVDQDSDEGNHPQHAE